MDGFNLTFEHIALFQATFQRYATQKPKMDNYLNENNMSKKMNRGAFVPTRACSGRLNIPC